MSDLIFSVENHIGLITLNRQSALNALTHDMIQSLSRQLLAWENDSTIHAVIIQAAEGRAFCAGGDIRSLYELGRKDKIAPLKFFYDEYRLNHQIYTYKKPYIALLDGLTFGGGVGISLHGRYTIGTERFVFAMPETSIGFFPDIGASFLLSQLTEAYGLYLGLTGQWVNASLAYILGLIRYQIEGNQIQDLLTELTQADLSNNAHGVIEACLQRYQTLNKMPLPDDSEKIQQYFSKDNILEIVEQLKTESNEWEQYTLKILLQKSPMSLCVTLEQLHRAKNKSLAECLQMDYGLTYQFMQHHDFFEGVRAMIIDKDKNPQWRPEAIDAINNEQVNAYFDPLPETVRTLIF